MAKPKAHIWGTTAVLILAGIFGFLSLKLVDPKTAGPGQVGAVFIFIFLAVSALAMILGYGFRVALFKSGLRQQFLRSARRQSLLLGIFTVAVLFLQTQGILTGRILGLILVIFFLLELYAR